MIHCFINLYLETSRRPAAERLVRQALDAGGIRASDGEWKRYEKTGGWHAIYRWSLDRPSEGWPVVVYEFLEAAQRMGYAWTLTDCISEILHISSVRPKVQGITMIALQVWRTESGIASPDAP
jgi:hypothetical protein